MAWGDNTKEPNNKGPWGKKDSGPQGAQKPSGSFGQPSGNRSQNDDNKIFDFDKIFKKPSGGGGFGGGSGMGGELMINGKGILAIALIAFFLWLATGFYVVDASEEGIVLRFGKYNRTATEGLRYHLPSPIEKRYIVRKTIINSIQVGYRSSSSEVRNNSVQKYRQTINDGVETKQLAESLMITGDTNIADVSFTVQWRIKDSFNYLFKVANPEQTMPDTIKAVAESAMREVIGRTNFAEAMTTKRSEIEDQVKNIIQTVLNSYDAGVEIYTVNLNDVQNPSSVMPAFLDVETAKQDKETAINRARAYENEVIPRARGNAQQMIQNAEAYKQQVVSVASGEAARFANVYSEYVKAKDVTKKRIYLETMQKIMAGTDKIIMGEGTGKDVVPYLPLNELNKKKKNSQPQQTEEL